MRKIQDIMRPDRRSIRNISINRESKKRSRGNGFSGGVSQSDMNKDFRSNKTPSVGLWVIAVVAVIFLFLTFTVLFSGTKVVVTQRSEHISVDTSFKAQREAEIGKLQYEVMSVDREVSRVVPSTGQEFQERKASGTITVYNDYNSQDQKLITKTRFETPEGLVYRIDAPIVVPGKHKDASGEVVPGSIEVRVYADEPGEKYNIDLKDFTVPGFKGSPQYKGFYARSKTKMEGGFSGMVSVVSESDRSKSIDSMQSELREILLEEARAQIPEGFVLYDDGITFNFISLPEKKADNNSVELVEKGELRGVIFDKEALSAHLAREQVDNYDGLAVEGADLEELIFVLENKGSVDILNDNEISFSLKGVTTLLWQFDEEALKTDLVSKRKRDVDWVLAEYPGIVEAQIIMRPFWKRSFPDNAKKIKIVKAEVK